MMPRIQLTIGQRFSNLVVLAESGKQADGKITWECICDCGAKTVANSSALQLGKKKSCGCRRGISAAARHYVHGLNGTPTYISWNAMLTRCTNQNAKTYATYGGAGVTVCERWRTFTNFYEDMKERPVGTSLDRINPFGNYEPGNCRWADRSTQAKNTRANASLPAAQPEGK